jgi:hypothetical protein
MNRTQARLWEDFIDERRAREHREQVRERREALTDLVLSILGLALMLLTLWWVGG